ncbi:MAG: NAD(P)-dependent oxidoreductase [Proteobacteria bacterium]|nr:NAD(P)-dependent oxidoreductase [Pseudomonadota bacterium]
MLLLVTGATGKVGVQLIADILQDPKWSGARIRALCHNRVPVSRDRVEIVQGNIAERDAVDRAMAGVTHVVHLATCKEIPETVMDVTVKGLFWLLEAFRQSPTAQQFVLIGGDAGIGHFFYEHDGPITEAQPHMAYPGCYALSKVLEEVMLTQFGIQYGINACCLRAPWIMEKDDFRYTLSFGDDVFGGPDWKAMVAPEIAAQCRTSGAVPLLRDAHGRPLKRNFVHVEDLSSAIRLALDNPATKGRLYNVSMDEPVDYGMVAAHLKATRGLPSIDIPSQYHSNWLDNARARYELGWRPRYDTLRMIDAAFAYQRSPQDPRKVWYPG